MNTLNAAIKTNNDALTDQGFTGAQWDNLKAKVAQVKALYEKHDELIADKLKAVNDNKVMFEHMWNITRNLAKAGKVVFKSVDITRVKEYVINTKLVRIRRDVASKAEMEMKTMEQKASKIGELSLTVKDFGIDESWIEDVMVEIVGTSYNLPTDEEGGLLVDLNEGTYTLIFRKETYQDVTIDNIVIKAGETTDLDVEMKASE
jgi:hypothetical protein